MLAGTSCLQKCLPGGRCYTLSTWLLVRCKQRWSFRHRNSFPTNTLWVTMCPGVDVWMSAKGNYSQINLRMNCFGASGSVSFVECRGMEKKHFNRKTGTQSEYTSKSLNHYLLAWYFNLTSVCWWTHPFSSRFWQVFFFFFFMLCFLWSKSCDCWNQMSQK